MGEPDLDDGVSYDSSINRWLVPYHYDLSGGWQARYRSYRILIVQVSELLTWTIGMNLLGMKFDKRTRGENVISKKRNSALKV